MTDNQAYFTHHEPCPRCGSRDNLGVWSDGHKWCFGCHYYVVGAETVHSVRSRIEGPAVDAGSSDNVDVSDWTYTLPSEPLTWLNKYGISPGEVIHFGLAWNTKTSSLVLPIRNGDKVVVAQERYFGPDPSRPKYITYGPKNKHWLYVQNPDTPDHLIIVEDYVSAIKVGRFVSTTPLLGSSMSENVLKWVAGRFKKVRVWLDMDKAVESLQTASRLSQFVWDARSVITELDPKEYTPQEILKKLREYGS